MRDGQAFSRRDRAATPKPRCTCWRSRAVWPGTCSTSACSRSAAPFPISCEAEAAGAVRHAVDAEALAALIGCDAAALAATLAGTRLAARPMSRSRSRARCSTPRAAWTSTPSAACCMTTARRFANLLAAAAQRAASRATRCGATCRATACSARWPVATLRRAPRPRNIGGYPMTLKQRLAEPRVLLAPGIYDALRR